MNSEARYRLGMIERLLIERIGHRGDGVAETFSGPVFIPCTLPGETVQVDRKGDRAGLLSIEIASPERVDPACEYFGRCGGCALQHWRTDKYSEWKRGLVSTALDRAGIKTDVKSLVDAHGKGRRRAVLHARGTGTALTVGFAERRSHSIIAIGHCPVFEPEMDRAIPIAGRVARKLAGTGKPLDLHFTLADNGIDLDIRGSGSLSAQQVADLASIAREEKLVRITRHGELVIQNTEPVIIVGKAVVRIPPGAFMQPTAKGEELLASLVIDAAARAKHVADLFSGFGTFALRLAESAKVMAADADERAIAALKAAANAPGLKPVEAIRRDLFRRPMTFQELEPYDCVVLDPPRQGAEAQIREIANSKLRKVIYVSCDAESFARDARILQDAGWKASAVTPIDQFRYSAHVETFCVLTR